MYQIVIDAVWRAAPTIIVKSALGYQALTRIPGPNWLARRILTLTNPRSMQ